MSNLTTARNILINAGFKQSVSFLDAAFDQTDAAPGSNALGNPNMAQISDDIVIGGAGAQILVGGPGSDILIGGAGGDSLIGGDGLDWASYATATARVEVNMLSMTSNIGDARGDVYSSIENLMGSAFGDILKGDNAANVISGLKGDDVIRGNGGNDTLFGDEGNDQLEGGIGLDTVNGGEGNDTLFSEGGDTMNGDAGNDTFSTSGNLADTMNGGSGDDTFYGTTQSAASTSGVWQMNGGEGVDTFFARNGAEAINGGTQLTADFREGMDHLSYSFALSGVTINLATGAGSGGAAGDTVAGIEWLTGSNFSDTLTGTTGNDRIEGGNGNDTIRTGGGRDAIYLNLSMVNFPTLEGWQKPNIGNDIVQDFDIRQTPTDQSFDVIDFHGLRADQFDDIVATQVGNDTVISSHLFDGTVTLLNTDANLWAQF